MAGTTVDADVALVFSWESWWAAEGEARPSQSVTYLEQVHAAHRALRSLGVTCDVVSPDADLSGYKLVVVPCLYMVGDVAAERITEYVAGGGHLLVTFFSGIVDERDRIRLGGYPGAFREVLGVRTEEFAPLKPGHLVNLSNGGVGSLWTERLRTTSAATIASYLDGPLPGTPAITRNEFGDGVAWYLATALDDSGMRDLVRNVVQNQEFDLENDEVEAVRRSGDGRSYLFVVNHGANPVEYPATGHNLITNEPVAGTLRVDGGGVAVVREEAAA